MVDWALALLFHVFSLRTVNEYSPFLFFYIYAVASPSTVTYAIWLGVARSFPHIYLFFDIYFISVCFFFLSFSDLCFFFSRIHLVFVFSKSNRQNSVYFSISGDWILFRCMCVRSVPAPNTKFHLAIRPNDDHLRYATQHTPTKTRRHPRNLILLLCITFIFSCCAYVFVK